MKGSGLLLQPSSTHRLFNAKSKKLWLDCCLPACLPTLGYLSKQRCLSEPHTVIHDRHACKKKYRTIPYRTTTTPPFKGTDTGRQTRFCPYPLSVITTTLPYIHIGESAGRRADHSPSIYVWTLDFFFFPFPVFKTNYYHIWIITYVGR